ncbi:MAG: tRNA (adenosine(37)-N6)-threonylcarbamoyltransferase complex ATPase subunit type 1 TsaE [Clostridium sp.]|nr:tRNA (adenosine(37)-N6)-threonylcarbamoyltransferase complex ATPase subunit type 1 TsaE [Clostridium sp.]
MIYETFCAEETFAIGRRLGERAAAGQIYTLNGELGVGKTVFTQGFAAGLSVPEPVNSPTFTIVQVYDTGRLPLYHFDAYRIGDAAEMDEIGYEDYFFGDGVCLIEWAERIREIIPAEAAVITIEKQPARGADYRRITIADVD